MSSGKAFLANLGAHATARLLSAGVVLELPPGATLIRRGEKGGDIYVVEAGSLEIVDDRLYLVGMNASPFEDEPVPLERLFPGHGDRVFAHWYSGTLRVPPTTWRATCTPTARAGAAGSSWTTRV